MPPDPAFVSFGPLIAATFLERPNRYLVVARVGRRRVEAACRDPGRLEGLLVPGAALRLRPAAHAKRRTAFDVALVRQRGAWVSLVPVLANRLLEAAILAGRAPGLRGARVLGREVARGRSRLDFLLAHRGRRVLAEVKSVGLVVDGRALFPDAPTARGRRHVEELAAHARRGGASLLAFVVQRGDATSMAPHRVIDPKLAAALREAAKAGVRLLAFRCRVSPRGAALERRLPIVLRPD